MSQSTIDSMVAALMPGWGGQQCSVDGLLTGCAFAMSLEASGAADRCPDDDCGTHTVTVIAKGADGHVIGSSTVVVTPGQPGWDGSLDGTYSVINSANNPVKFNGSPDAINTFLNAAATAGPSGIGEFTTSYGGVAFQKTLGTPQNLAPLPNRTNNNLINATNALASKLASGVSEDCQKNVIDKLKGIGFDLNGFINFLGNNPQFGVAAAAGAEAEPDGPTLARVEAAGGGEPAGRLHRGVGREGRAMGSRSLVRGGVAQSRGVVKELLAQRPVVELLATYLDGKDIKSVDDYIGRHCVPPQYR